MLTAKNMENDKIEGLELSKDECIDNKGSVTGIYRYNSIYDT